MDSSGVTTRATTTISLRRARVEARRGLRLLISALAPTLRALQSQSVPQPKEVREGAKRVHARRVLGEAAIPHLREAPESLDHQKRMLDGRANPRARAVDGVGIGGALPALVHQVPAAAELPL